MKTRQEKVETKQEGRVKTRQKGVHGDKAGNEVEAASKSGHKGGSTGKAGRRWHKERKRTTRKSDLLKKQT